MEMADFQKMEEVRARVARSSQDPATAEALKPYYRQFCKRPCFHDEYLADLQPPQRHAGRHEGPGRRAHHRDGRRGRRPRIRARLPDLRHRLRGRHRLRAPGGLRARSGAAAQTLTEKWRDGVRTLHGIHIHGFPNCFMMSIAQSGFTVNFPLHDQRAGEAHRLRHRARAGRAAAQRSRRRRRPRREWVETIIARSRAQRRLRRAAARRATTTTRASRARRAARTASSSAARPSSSSSSSTGGPTAPCRVSNAG